MQDTFSFMSDMSQLFGECCVQLGIFYLDFRYNTTDIVWNQGLTWKIPTAVTDISQY